MIEILGLSNPDLSFAAGFGLGLGFYLMYEVFK